MTPFAWPVISLGLFFVQQSQNIILLYHYSFYLANLNRFFEVGKLIALQFQDFAIFQNFLRQKGSVSFDLVDKLDKILLGNPFH
jgi:hypothetical protein